MPPTKEKTTSIPSKVQDFTILPLQLPSQSSYQSKTPQQHYLYLRRDAPRPGEEPSADVRRSLFVANWPVDATEGSVRGLFKQICGGLVERVEFEDDQSRERRGLVIGGEMIVQGTKVSVPVDAGGRGKKRKRGALGGGEEEVVKRIVEEIALPQIWDRQVLRSGSNGVVVFVDESSRDAALKECARVKRKGRVIEWPTVEGDELGLQREFLHMLWIEVKMPITTNRLSYPPRPHISLSLPSPTQRKHLLNPFHRSRIRSLKTPHPTTPSPRRRRLRHSNERWQSGTGKSRRSTSSSGTAQKARKKESRWRFLSISISQHSSKTISLKRRVDWFTIRPILSHARPIPPNKILSFVH